MVPLTACWRSTASGPQLTVWENFGDLTEFLCVTRSVSHPDEFWPGLGEMHSSSDPPEHSHARTKAPCIDNTDSPFSQPCDGSSQVVRQVAHPLGRENRGVCRGLNRASVNRRVINHTGFQYCQDPLVRIMLEREDEGGIQHQANFRASRASINADLVRKCSAERTTASMACHAMGRNWSATIQSLASLA